MKDIIFKSILPNVSKPARYVGSELNSAHKNHEGRISVALSYPDTYEIGMSNIGLQILYHILNKRDDTVAERVYCPWPDMEEKMKQNGTPLFSLESCTPIRDFDIIGFSVQNELTYTNLLNILMLSGIPLKRTERNDGYPLVIAGGSSTNNPGPLSDFIDAFVIGDGEEVIVDIVETYKKCKGLPKHVLLRSLAALEGVYVPGVNESKNVKRRIVKDIDTIDYPTKPVVPFIEIVHDRAAIEIMRGCPRRCSFCQAGHTHKPVRMMNKDNVIKIAKELLKNTGFEELSLVSLSSSDYPWIWEVAEELSEYLSSKKISLSLPSMRPDTFGSDIAKKINMVRKAGITLAPEAGTQRLRDLICKDLDEEKIIGSIKTAFSAGANSVKLYFMIGLPTETQDDLQGIADLAYKIINEGRSVNPRAKITVNLSTFVPKKNTPFENEKMITLPEILDKQDFLKKNLRHRSIELRWHDAKSSVIEGLFSSGGQELGNILLKAYDLGCRFDNWSEYFDFSKWEAAIAARTDKI